MKRFRSLAFAPDWPSPGHCWFLLGEKGQQALVPDDFGRGDYRPVMSGGQPVTEASLRGQPSLDFFGFTHCPDVCPTTLGDIALRKSSATRASEFVSCCRPLDPETRPS